MTTEANPFAEPPLEGSALQQITENYKVYPLCNNGNVGMVRILADHTTIIYDATEVRKDRNGAVKARISLGISTLNGRRALAYDRLDVDRHEERVRLANAAHGRLDKARQELYTKVIMRHDLDQFCEAIWPTFVGSHSAQLVTPEKKLPEFLLKPYILKNAGTIVFGPPGTGKSYLGILMGISVDAGVETNWEIQHPCKVLIINLERSAESFNNRIACCNEVLGVPDHQRPILTLNARGKSLVDLQEIIKGDIEKHGVELVVLDSISRAGAGSMIKDDVGNAITDTLNNFGTAWLAIGHSPREDADHIYGSQMFDAAADVVVKTTGEKKEETIGMVLEVTKDNDIGYQPKEFITYEFNDYGLADFRKSQPGEFTILEDKISSDIDKIINHLKKHGASTANQVSDFTGVKSNTVRAYFTRHTDVFVFVKRVGKEVAYGLLQPEE